MNYQVVRLRFEKRTKKGGVLATKYYGGIRMFFRKCKLCKGKAVQSRNYIDDNGKKIKVCYKCIPYAERRAYVIYN